MAYFSKPLLLKAYKTINSIHQDSKTQGATQTISALKYFFALEMFYTKYNRPCDTSKKEDKKEFCSFVGAFVDVNDNYFTSDFYFPLKPKSESSDYNVGSNFFSVNSVKTSRSNGGQIIKFPTRGNTPLICIQNGSLLEDKSLFDNLSSYLNDDATIFCAIAIWLSRNYDIDSNYIFASTKSVLDNILPSELVGILMPKQEVFESFMDNLDIIVEDTKCKIEESEINMLFSEKQPITTEQIIYFGAPGTGKSFKIECREGETEEDRIRTTFHPDTDYSSFVGCYKPVPKENDDDKITYKFVPQCFTKAYVKAWKRFIKQKEIANPNFTLVIEEINRGNCAQIFGDIFQLLDRSDDGFSQYGITPDIDLTNHLKGEFNDVKKIMSKQGYEKISTGEEMKLPPNFSIIATMNTSDQSLFPIDSAFKRRWDWEYIPIDYSPKDAKTGEDISFKIDINGNIYDWGRFIDTVNKRIYKLTHSEDKQLGYFFVKPTNGGNISLKRFVSKVIFYLWSDIYKDYAGRKDSVFNIDDEDISFNMFFKNGKINENLVKRFIENLIGDDNQSTNEILEDRNKINPTFSINGEGEHAARQLSTKVMELFVKQHSNLTPEEVVSEWMSLGVSVPHFVETKEQYDVRTDSKERVQTVEWENGMVYLSTHGWVYSTNEQYKFSTILQFINAVNNKNWGIKLDVN